MQSEQDPQIHTLSHTNIRPEVLQDPKASPQHGNPRAQDILANLKKADNPLEFIKQNLKSPEPRLVDPQAMLDAHMPTPPPASTPPSTPTPAPLPVAEPPAPTTPEPLVDEPVEDGDPVAASPTKVPIEENYKILRTQFKETKKTLETLQQERAALTEKLEKYEKGEATPEAIAQLQSRIAELEPLERVLNLKKSPAYHTKFVEPLNRLGGELAKIAKDYEVPEDVMHEAMSYTNRAARNRFLLNHFDELGGMEVNKIVDEMQRIKGEAQSAEQEPVRALAAIQEEHKVMQERRQAERAQTITQRSKSAWVRAVSNIRAEGRVKELIPRDNDPAFNEQWVRPIQEKAATEYGRLISALAASGLEDLPDALAEDLADAALLRVASAVAIERANAAESYANAVEASATRRHTMIRPSIGGGGGGASSTPAPTVRPDSPMAAGARILQQIGVLPHNA